MPSGTIGGIPDVSPRVEENSRGIPEGTLQRIGEGTSAKIAEGNPGRIPEASYTLLAMENHERELNSGSSLY